MEDGRWFLLAFRYLLATSGLEEAVDNWDELITRLRIGPDFQTKDYIKLTQAHFEKNMDYGRTIKEIRTRSNDAMGKVE